MEKIKFKISRFDPDVAGSKRFDTFEFEPAKNMSVLEALFNIVEQLDGSLAFRYSCRGAVCGSCAMYINGQNRLACQTLVENLHSKTVTISPLPHQPVIKDLVVDMDRFFKHYETIRPYLINNSAPLAPIEASGPEKERLQSPEERKAIDEMINCILCGACYSACSLTALNKDYLGPAALTKAYRFLADSRDQAKVERLKLVNGETGAFRCHTLFNCAEVCPKNIVPTYSIQQLKIAAIR